MDKHILDVLEKIEELDKTNHFAQLPRPTAQMLHALALSSQSKSILELGTSAGYSTIWLASAAIKNQGIVYTIDNDQKKVALARKHFEESRLGNIELIEGDFIVVLKKWDKEVDFLFIDGEKSKYLDYLKLVEPFLQKGAIIVADNIVSIGKGTINVEKKTASYRKYVEEKYKSILIEIGDGMMISKK